MIKEDILRKENNMMKEGLLRKVHNMSKRRYIT